MADITLSVTSSQLNTAGQQAHAHANKSTLDKFSEAAGQPTFSGQELASAADLNDVFDTATQARNIADNAAATAATAGQRTEEVNTALMERIEALEAILANAPDDVWWISK